MAAVLRSHSKQRATLRCVLCARGDRAPAQWWERAGYQKVLSTRQVDVVGMAGNVTTDVNQPLCVRLVARVGAHKRPRLRLRQPLSGPAHAAVRSTASPVPNRPRDPRTGRPRWQRRSGRCRSDKKFQLTEKTDPSFRLNAITFPAQCLLDRCQLDQLVQKRRTSKLD